MRLPKYADYKDSGVTWVGDVPKQWSVVPLLGVARERYESNTGMQEENLLSLSYGRIVRRDSSSNDGLLPASYGTYQVVYPGDIVFRLTDLQNDKRSLRTASVSEKGIITSAYLAVAPENIDSSYFAHLLRFYDATKVFYSMGGGLRQSMKYGDVKRLPILIPPAKEQQAIAAFLDCETGKIDALIAGQEKLLTLLAEKRQATISHAVTRGLNPNAPMKDSGVPWLGEVPVRWKKVKLLDLAAREQHAFVNGPFGSDLLTAELVDDGVPVIYIRDIKDDGYRRISEWCVTQEKADQLKFCSVMAGDVIIAKVGDPPGLAAVYPNDGPVGIVTQDVIRLRLNTDEAVPGYVRWLLNSDYGRTMVDDISVESTRTRVGLGEYKQLRFFLPPVHEQGAIASFLDREVARLTMLRLEAKSGIDLLKERRNALIATAVTGKIDVRAHQ